VLRSDVELQVVESKDVELQVVKSKDVELQVVESKDVEKLMNISNLFDPSLQSPAAVRFTSQVLGGSQEVLG
jgi:hypothetical protein